MCGGPEKSKSLATASSSAVEGSANNKDMKNLTIHTEDPFPCLLELASNNDCEDFQLALDRDVSLINEVGLWYVRQIGSKQIGLKYRTLLMVAAMYGSIDVLKLILSCPEADVNATCGADKSTALHRAASGGSVNAVDVVKLLLAAGADIRCVDANGNFPVDVIVFPPKLEGLQTTLQDLLSDSGCDGSVGDCLVPASSVNSSCSHSAAHLSTLLDFKKYE